MNYERSLSKPPGLKVYFCSGQWGKKMAFDYKENEYIGSGTNHDVHKPTLFDIRPSELKSVPRGVSLYARSWLKGASSPASDKSTFSVSRGGG